jgi:hypothetical protein
MFILFSNRAYAQNRWSVAFRPDINFPTQDLGDANIKTGYGYEITCTYRFMPNISEYAVWGGEHV